MSSDPTTVNEGAAIANKVIRDIITGAVALEETAVEAALKVYCPFLAAPVISQLTDFIINEISQKIGDQVYLALGQYSTLLIIDFQTVEEKNTYLDSIKLLSQTPQPGVDHDKALADARAALGALIHSDGSYTS